MTITNLSVLGYRGFKVRRNISFATPTGEEGSGLTLLTGPNNSGKSSILECLRARVGYQNVSFTSGTRNSDVDHVEIAYTVNSKIESIKSITKGSSETKRSDIDQSFEIFILPSRRAFNPYFHKSTQTREQFLQNSTLPPQRSSVLSQFESRLFKILEAPEQFNKLVEEVLGFHPTWTIDQSDQGQHFLKFYNGKKSHSSDGMGEGIFSLFAIVDSLYDSKPGGMIAIDEPELSLHPTIQKRLANLLCRFASDRQIVVSTHSPYFVSLKSLANGGNIARVISSDDGTEIHELSALSKTSVSTLSSGNIYNPHVFGLDARELFFQEDRIILTEGQEDVLLFPLIAKQLSMNIEGNFFGWGAGGAGNIPHLCRILKDLGFKKVAAVLDGDKVDDRDRLRTEFTDYFFECIPAKDIRTKPARPATCEVSGLLDRKLQVNPEFSSAMADVLSALNSHMNKE